MQYQSHYGKLTEYFEQIGDTFVTKPDAVFLTLDNMANDLL